MFTDAHITKIAAELNLPAERVQATAVLLQDGATVPFIARYRKEATGSLDEVAITTIRDRLEQLAALDLRRAAILESLAERELLTAELETQINAAETMAVLEDIYLPYRPKRRTRATIARERGLEPLAMMILAQETDPPIDPWAEAAAFVDEEKGVANADEALAGARDIIAEHISEDQQARARIRELFNTKGLLSSRVAKDMAEDGVKYKDYFEWNELLHASPSHRVLAMFRGEHEGFLKLCIEPPEEEAIDSLFGLFVRTSTPAAEQVALAVEDGYKRLLRPSLETELRNSIKQKADEKAIRVFASNLRELLLAPPLGRKKVLALDPGFRTGCKLVCLDGQGKLLHHDTIYPHTGEYQAQEAGKILISLCEQYAIDAIAVGNGTAGRETERFIRSLELSGKIPVVMVNESGASVYSASKLAREEFPDYDVTVRGAISIGRRLLDPLAELVKIDPKSIGVGQYQHDVDQAALKRSLDDVVISCVNAVGVELNTTSKQLLTYVSGLGPQLAGNIIAYRDEHGPFTSREQLKKVPRLGPKAFEQAAGFLRIPDGENPLDASAVHPESYFILDMITKDLGCRIEDLMHDEELRACVELEDYVTANIGLPTLQDIMAELAKPGRDPRAKFEPFSFAEGIENIEDLRAGMRLPGIVTNVTAFGAFVDIGVHQDGLVHKSRLADRYVKNPADVIKINQQVHVTVLEVDLARNRISLSMRNEPQQTTPPARRDD